MQFFNDTSFTSDLFPHLKYRAELHLSDVVLMVLILSSVQNATFYKGLDFSVFLFNLINSHCIIIIFICTT